VFNNAGVATSQTVADAAIEDDEWVHAVNFGGVVNGTHAFLPILLRQGSGVIVNTSSVFGLVGIPGQSAYCASKFAVRGFTDSLRQELRGSGVRAVCVHPGGVKTNIARNARYHSHPTRQGVSHAQAVEEFDQLAMTTPERAAKIIHDGVKAGRSRILVGPDAYLFDLLARTMPTHYYGVLSAVQAVAERVSPPPAAA
jgi:short-subunit dehydrogenase